MLWFWMGGVSMFRYLTRLLGYTHQGLLNRALYYAVDVFVLLITCFLIISIEKQVYKKIARLLLLLIPSVFVFMSVSGTALQAFSDMSGNYSMLISVGIPLVLLIHIAQAINDNKEFALLKSYQGEALSNLERVTSLSLSLYIFSLSFLFIISVFGAIFSFSSMTTMFVCFILFIPYYLLCFYTLVAWQKLRLRSKARTCIWLFSGLNFIINLLICLFMLSESIAIYFAFIALLSLIVFMSEIASGIKRGYLD